MPEKKREIIIIDDDLEIIESVTFILSKRGIGVRGFPNGNDAIEFIKKNEYRGVLLCDAQMPKIDGWDVVKRIAGEGLGQRLVVNMLTGVTDPPEKSESCAPYIFEYLTKPFENEELVRMIESSFAVLEGDVA
ncbi:response regulator [Pseudobacteriovorax antillogorgiicola]|uniref:Response regulator receiver domain-containing protein n=1 Tax=Pseudobacteriovorax antillogorgiicola TaxID=1513793 RepID=A0A1Y6CHP2_9BACT|nr:response regulator [Pseudobacteriovorax antillogorgiicola]TCS47337.1 response regulator receiver domain-containing protein [Pseudobacteriovorax antillogorgiicola]SMF63107.1 Response regulator receiver domain-containing protein [Pseudobacteriovorax antillogorgiicola]